MRPRFPEDLVVQITSLAENDALLLYLESIGMHWATGDKPTQFKYYDHDLNNYLYLNGGKWLTFGHAEISNAISLAEFNLQYIAAEDNADVEIEDLEAVI